MATTTASHERRPPALCPTDDDAILPAHATKHKVNKQSTGAPGPSVEAVQKPANTAEEYIWKSGVAGGLAGCAAKTVVGPLDRVKILFQASNPQFAKYTGSWFGVVTAMRDIYAANGTRGLFRGHSATLLRIFPYAGIKFLAYEQVRALLIPTPAHETPGRRFLSGSLAGSLSVFVTYPLEVVRVRLAFDTRQDRRASLRGVCRQIYRERAPPLAASPSPSPSLAASASAFPSPPPAASASLAAASRSGLSNFYRGFTPTLWGMLPYAGSSFLTHDVARDLLRGESVAAWTTLPGTAGPAGSGRAAQLTTAAQLLAGGLAGFVSQTASYPLEVVRRRMQVGGVVGDGRRLRMRETAAAIWRERGWRGFFVGLGIGYVKVVPMVAASFYVYERGKYYLGI